jgi:hypothetical protein
MRQLDLIIPGFAAADPCIHPVKFRSQYQGVHGLLPGRFAHRS